MSNSFDRREFARRAVLSSLAVGTAAVATAQEEPDKPETEPAEAEPLGKPEELLLEIIRQQYPSENLTPDVLNQIRRDISSHRSRSRTLKSVPLTNGEAPFVFRAHRSDDGSGTESIRIEPRKTPDDTKSD
jgi:hypothetical protein